MKCLTMTRVLGWILLNFCLIYWTDQVGISIATDWDVQKTGVYLVHYKGWLYLPGFDLPAARLLLGNLDHYRDWNLDKKNSVAEKTKVSEIWNSINLMTGCRPMYWFFLLIVRIILSAISVSLHGMKNWPNYENSLISMGLEPMDDEKPYTLTACALTGEL